MTTTTLKSRRTGEDLRYVTAEDRNGEEIRKPSPSQGQRQARMDKERNEYILNHAPTILAALVIRRSSSRPDLLVEQAIDGVRKLFDVVYDLDTPATTMLSQPVDGAR
jgi:hypothetical protein